MTAYQVGTRPWNLCVGCCCMMIALGTSLPGVCKADDRAAILAGEDSESEQAEARFPIRKGGKWGYINREGKVVIEPGYDNARQFHNGRALVQVGEKWGYVDRRGTLVIPPNYTLAGDFSEGLAVVKGPNGSRRLMRVGYVDTTGKLVIKPRQYGELRDAGFRDGRALVRLIALQIRLDPLRWEKQYGYIDKSGEFAIASQFDPARPFSDSLAKVWKDGKAMFIDTTGKVVLDVTRYRYTGDFSEGLASVAEPVQRGGKIGFINRQGQMVVAPAYDRVDRFSEGLAAVAVGWNHRSFVPKGMKYVPAKWSYIDEQGNVVIQPNYWWACPFSEGLACVRLEEGGKFGYIDRKGKMVIRPQFDTARNFRHGLAQVTVGDRWEEYNTPSGKGKRLVYGKLGYINKAGEYVWGPTE